MFIICKLFNYHTDCRRHYGFFYICVLIRFDSANSMESRGHLELRHSVSHLFSNFRGIACWVAQLYTTSRIYSHSLCPCATTGGNEIFEVFICFRWSRDKEQRWVPPLNTRCSQKFAENVQQSVLILGSLCLSCCVRDTAWS